MPSFVIHSIVGNELIKKYNWSDQEQKEFFLGNLLADTISIDLQNNSENNEYQKKIQNIKSITHFRGEDEDEVVKYPILSKFLVKYKKDLSNKITLGYYLHLYTDHYYFTTFLTTEVKFLDKNKNITTKRSKNEYIKTKNSDLIKKEVFWSKTNPNSLYSEYTRMNKYLINKYKFKYNKETYLDFVDIVIEKNTIEETYPESLPIILNKIEKFIEPESTDKEFKIFIKEDVDDFIETIINNFIKENEKIL